ncbi:hypothetical protein BDV18DRAFT_130215 [Aspergillus unguis]
MLRYHITLTMCFITARTEPLCAPSQILTNPWTSQSPASVKGWIPIYAPMVAGWLAVAAAILHHDVVPLFPFHCCRISSLA